MKEVLSTGSLSTGGDFMSRGLRSLSRGLVSAVGTALRRWDQSPLSPHSHRHWQQLSHQLLSRAYLHELLDPRPDEQILEISPRTGYYAIDIARWLDSGTLTIVGRQTESLKKTSQRALQRNSTHTALELVCGDAQALPYPADHFDAVYLVSALGRIPEQQRALQEIHRILRPGGRLVIGEVFYEPDFIQFETLWERASRARFQFAGKRGGQVGYFARFEVGSRCLK